MDAVPNSLEDRLRSVTLPQVRVVLSAVQDTLRDQKTEPTATAYFSVVLVLLGQSIPASDGVLNGDLATSVVYLLDTITPFVPTLLLRSKFSQILAHLSVAFAHVKADAPLLRPATGCLESILVVQDAAAWDLSQTQVGPRAAIAILLNLALDRRPKVRKRALQALTKVLTHPPTPYLYHPAAELCAETSLKHLRDLAAAAGKSRRQRSQDETNHDPPLIHALQLVKTIAAASGGWPSENLEPLCELLLDTAKSSHEYLIMATFDVFEAIFLGMTDELASAKLPRLLEVVSQLRPSDDDSHLLPPWVAILTRGHDVWAHVNPQEAFQELPKGFRLLSGFLASTSSNIRESASEGLVSLLENCIPDLAPWDRSGYADDVFAELAEAAKELLTVKYRDAWEGVFKTIGVMFEAFQVRADPSMEEVLKVISELRSANVFQGKKEADEVIGQAVAAMGPESALRILPLNLLESEPGQPGRAWMLPILRKHVSNASLAHFRSEFVPLSAAIFQKIIERGDAEHTMETKIFETVVQQIWGIFPGYCDLPRGLQQSFDQGFAEQIATILYKQVQLRADVCKALQNLVDSNKAIVGLEENAEQVAMRTGISTAEAQQNLEYLATFAGNVLAVLFNVYSETLPQYRGYILTCINAYLSITPQEELNSTFSKVVSLFKVSLEEAGGEQQVDKRKKSGGNKLPPMSHTFMTLIITMAPYLPHESYPELFTLVMSLVQSGGDAQLQKKAYKLFPRLSESEAGTAALRQWGSESADMLVKSSDKVASPARRDRLAAIACLMDFTDRLEFIPSVLPETIISVKEVNEKAREAAFDLLVKMGRRMESGGSVVMSRVSNMPADAPDRDATLTEYFTMVAAGLADTSPHVVSATVTALARLLYEFRGKLEIKTIDDLVSTVDEFLISKNREVVRSVLGFVKVCVISLPVSVLQSRLQTLVPNLVRWNHEQRARFKAKIKHILERMIRRFGLDAVAKHCPAEDQKLITNIRKTKERRKRKKDANDDDDPARDDAGKGGKSSGAYGAEFDEALYGSDDSVSSSDEEVTGRKPSQKKQHGTESGRTFIVEDDDDDPIDLLDPKSLARMTSTKPRYAQLAGNRKKMKAQTNTDGKLVLGGDGDDGGVTFTKSASDTNATVGGADPGAGVNAFVEALKGKHAAQRGQRGRLKFSNKGRAGDDDNNNNNEGARGSGGNVDEDVMDIDELSKKVTALRTSNAKPKPKPKQTQHEAAKGRANRSGRGGIKATQNQRRGLGALLTGTKTRDAATGGSTTATNTGRSAFKVGKRTTTNARVQSKRTAGAGAMARKRAKGR